MLHSKKLFRKIGPGVITGASDDDPAGIITYTQTGAQYGNQLLWLSFITTPLMTAVQEMSARLGLVTGKGLADLVREHLSSKVAWIVSVLLLAANTVNIGADLGALAEVTQLLVAGPRLLYLILFAAVIALLEIFLTYKKYVNILKWLTLAIFSYVAVVFFVNIDWADAARHFFLPSLPGDTGVWMIIVAVLGTTISPYLFFWQTSEEAEERKTTRQTSTVQELTTMRRDTWSGMILSNVIMLFIIMAAAATLHQAGVTSIDSAGQAAEALRPIAGPFTFALFALGVLGTGLLAIPVLAGSAAYALAEVMRQPEGLAKPFRQAWQFYLVIALSIGVGVVINFLGIAPVRMLIISAVINGLLAPVMLFLILQLADRRSVVGEFGSPVWVRMAGWIAFAVMTLAAGGLTFQWLVG